MKNTTTLGRYYSPAEAAELMGLNGQTVRRYLRQHRIRAVKLQASPRQRNAPWRIPESALTEFMEGNAA